jgi:hypothetical protein
MAATATATAVAAAAAFLVLLLQRLAAPRLPLLQPVVQLLSVPLASR